MEEALMDRAATQI